MFAIYTSDAEKYYYLCALVSFIVSTLIVESIVYTLPNVRTAYTAIPALGIVFFFFSALIIKPDTLPGWASPWCPSLSYIRWLSQGLTINEYIDNRDAFPLIGPNAYSTYDGFMTVLGWGGKTKYYCLRVAVINIILFKGFNFIVTVLASLKQRGKRTLRKSNFEERLY